MDNRNVHEVVQQFNQVARAYDQQRRMLIPCFDDFYGVAVSLAEAGNDAPRILDLGAGTGLLTAFMLQKYPKASYTLIDLSENMLEMAKSRFAGMEQMTYVVDDYTTYRFDAKFDLIVSALSIHHLEDAEKRRLYQNCYHHLGAGGVFVNCDQVLGQSGFLDALYKNDWRSKVASSELSEDAKAAAYERTKLDKMAPLAAQLGWLAESGFTDVDCVYKYYNFVVMYGRKL